MLTTIKLSGLLGNKFGKEHRLDVETVGEAVRALDANRPGFKRHLSINNVPGYEVMVGEGLIGEKALNEPTGGETIQIIPIIAGAGKNIGQIILGAVLIAASIYFPPMASSLAVFESAAWGYMQGIGVAMMLGGMANILAPSPDLSHDQNEKTENKPNYSFNGVVNTVGQGHPIPVFYGELMVGGQIISAGMSVDAVGGTGKNFQEIKGVRIG